jgi:acyl carrier protein
MSEFYTGMAEILEVDEEIGPDYPLGEGWDSLAIVSTIALIDEVYGTTVSANDLKACTTVGDVEKLAQEGE